MHQDKAFAILKSGRNVFLTGSAGTGKTHLLRRYIQYLRAQNISVAVTASTGIAATHMNGQTIHSWSGIGVRDSINEDALRDMFKRRHIRKNIDKVKVLIIDEISMLHQQQFQLIDTVLRFFKGAQAPFGGVQLVISGDFFQLPPIGSNNEASRDTFCFMSEVWLKLNLAICYLDTQYRQTDDTLFTLLNEIRQNNISSETLSTLQQRNTSVDLADTIKLLTHNVNVDAINNKELAQLNTAEKTYIANTTGRDSAKAALKKSILVQETLKLKIGAKVLFVKNNPEAGYMNGTMGKVVRFDQKSNYPIVDIDGIKKTIAPETWQLENDEGDEIAAYTQIPLRLAWAITVHKSQGMTLDSAVIDLSKSFVSGQGYVALSRIRNLQGLYLVGFNDTALQVDKLALKADIRFQALSKELDEQSDETYLQQNEQFLKRNKSK